MRLSAQPLDFRKDYEAMALTNVLEILQDADSKNRGVVGFNTMNFEEVAWIIETAEEEGVPVIIMLHPYMSQYSMPFYAHAQMTRALAEQVKVPVGLHLDHSESFDEVMRAIQAGFTSVMIDGSQMRFEENVALTAAVCRVAKAIGVVVEGELGRIGLASNEDDFMDKSLFTKPEDAVAFIEKTGVDSLAVAIGSAHGHYVREPKLDLDRLREINAATETPLVLHGGSGIPDEQLLEAAKNGINKLNVGTEYGHLFYKHTEELIGNGKTREDWMWCMDALKPLMKAYIRQKLHILGY